jgi:amino acid transporter
MATAFNSPARLIRALGPVLATAVVVGTVIGTGVFKKPQAVAENVPYFGLAALVWIVGGVLVMLGALAYAEVATLYPRAGGNYVFLREGYGPLAGFLWGWVEFFMIRSASLAALATIFSDSFDKIVAVATGGSDLGYWGKRAVTVSIILGLGLVNVRGVRWGGVLQLLITLVKVASLFTIILLPIVVLLLPALFVSGAAPSSDNLNPVWPSQDQFHFGLFIKFGVALLAVQWAYHGWQNMGPVAEEVKEPQRNIPLALLGGVGIVIGLYLGCNLSYCLVLTQDEMKVMKEQPSESVIAQTQGADSSEKKPHHDIVAIGFSERLLGSLGATLAAAAIMCSAFGALNGNILVGPRLLYAMSQDGLAPRFMGAVHARFHTPATATLVLCGWSALMVLGLGVLTETRVLPAGVDHFDLLTDFAMFGAVIFETMAVLAIFVFRRRYPNADRPYRCWGYPVVPVLYVLLPALILTGMFVDEKQRWKSLVGLAFIATGIGVYRIIVQRTRQATSRPELSPDQLPPCTTESGKLE